MQGSGRVQLAQRACAVAAAAVLGGVAEGLKNFAFNMLLGKARLTTVILARFSVPAEPGKTYRKPF